MITTLTWQSGVTIAEESCAPWVLATVISTSGSSPRNAGSKIVITESQCFDTIGGGKLEYLVTQKAKALILEASENSKQLIEHFPLSVRTQQCCGGSVSVLMEYFAAPSMRISLFGAGHVASALIPILGALPAQINWVDNRQKLVDSATNTPENTQKIFAVDPVEFVNQMPANTIALVMTHDHQLDYQLVCALLDKGNCKFIGLIGSETKARRFKKRLRSDSFSKEDISQLHCPVGLQDVPGKLPIEIAISIAAQIIQFNNTRNTCSPSSGLNWNEMKTSLLHSKAPEGEQF